MRDLGAQLQTDSLQIRVEGRCYLRKLCFHGVLDVVELVFEALDLLAGVGDEAADSVEHLLLVSEVSLLIGGGGLRLE
jgi:hypothetical protein